MCDQLPASSQRLRTEIRTTSLNHPGKEFSRDQKSMSTTARSATMLIPAPRILRSTSLMAGVFQPPPLCLWTTRTSRSNRSGWWV